MPSIEQRLPVAGWHQESPTVIHPPCNTQLWMRRAVCCRCCGQDNPVALRLSVSRSRPRRLFGETETSQQCSGRGGMKALGAWLQSAAANAHG